MELSQKYIYEIYTKKSFSKAARSLFISQPSLSAMVKKREEKLGFRVFDRTKNPLSLTPQGEIYISYLEECLKNEKIMKNRIKSLSERTTSELLIGGGNFLSSVLYPIACRKIHHVMPNLNIKIDMGANGNRHNIKDKIDSGILDLAVAYTVDRERFDAIPILEENYYFTVRSDLPGAQELLPYSVNLDEVISGEAIEMDSMQHIPSSIPILRRASLPSMDLTTYINDFPLANCWITNMRSGELFYEFMLQGLGADITSDLIIAAKKSKSRDVLFIPILPPYGKRIAYVIYKRNSRLSEGAAEFIKVIHSICNDKWRFLAEIG